MDSKRLSDDLLVDKRDTASLLAAIKPRATLSASPLPRQAPRRRSYFVQDDEDADFNHGPASVSKPLEHALGFHYTGDVFAQRGVYTEASLYMSRLPQTRKQSVLRQKAGANYKAPVKLAPVQQTEKTRDTAQQTKVGRKQQYALAIESMASNPILHASLLNDNAIPSILALCRTKDPGTLASCLSTLCYLSGASAGREAILHHNALALLTNLTTSVTVDKRILTNTLATLANLTIEDSFESVFVRDKGLDSVLKHRKTSEHTEQAATFAIFNLACPAFSYPRVDDVIRALVEHGKDCRDRETLSRAVYNLACTKMNQSKLVEPETMNLLRALVRTRGASEVRLNTLAAFWHLAVNPNCRKAITRSETVRALVEELAYTDAEEQIKCTMAILLNLAVEQLARELMGRARALDVLAGLTTRVTRADTELVAYRLMAMILSAPANVSSVSEEFLQFLVRFKHEADQTSPMLSRYVLFCLAAILAWNGHEDHTTTTSTGTGSSATGTTTSTSSTNSASVISATATTRATTNHERQNAFRLDHALDAPEHLHRIYEHVSCQHFSLDSPELYLQVLLLYNMSFRYNKVEVAKLACARLRDLGSRTDNAQILSLVCGSLFSLCQEYEAHAVLLNTEVLAILDTLARKCDQDAQAMCLEIVCIMFDTRKLSRTHAVKMVERLFPVLVSMCTRGAGPTRVGVAACLARFAMIDECRPTMVAQGLITSLSILASEEDAQTLRLCVHAYSYLSRDPHICAKLIHSGIVKSLTYLAAAPEEAVRRACAMTLCNLSTAEENIGALVKFGALRALLVISCVKSNDPETRRICMKAVMNLLRLPANIPQMCQDGLVWAFSLFTGGMEPKDYEIISDGFGALAFYDATRRGIVKLPVLTAILAIFAAPTAPVATKVKLLRGLSNALCDHQSAALLLEAGVLPQLAHLIERDGNEHDINALVAQVLTLLFQHYAEAENEFAQPAVIQTVLQMLTTSSDDCLKCCAVLLHLMSLHARLRLALLETDPSLVGLLPTLCVQGDRDTQMHLLRCVFNYSCDRALMPQLCTRELLAAMAHVLQKQSHGRESACVAAAILRNFSCDAACHPTLMADAAIPTATTSATALLRSMYDVDDAACKEDAAIAVCNLFLGQINSNLLLSQAVLPLVLWLCSHAQVDNLALASAVLRKLAIAPGNTQKLVDGGVISHLALLMHDCSSMYVKKNCVATFCLISRKTGVPAVLASYGVISSVLELLEGKTPSDRLFEVMCVDLLSTLAEYARADDPHEGKVSSTIYRLIENDDDCTALGANAWQNDRTFLQREERGDLPPTKLSIAYRLERTKVPSFRYALYPIIFPGYSVEFNQAASRIDMRTIEPIFPSLGALGDAQALLPMAGAAASDESDEGNTDGDVSARNEYAFDSPRASFSSTRMIAGVEFTLPPMYTKLRTPFAPMLASSTGSSSTFIGGNNSRPHGGGVGVGGGLR